MSAALRDRFDIKVVEQLGKRLIDPRLQLILQRVVVLECDPGCLVVLLDCRPPDGAWCQAGFVGVLFELDGDAATALDPCDSEAIFFLDPDGRNDDCVDLKMERQL